MLDTVETAAQLRARLALHVPGYLSDRDIARIMSALLDSGFIEKLAEALIRQLADEDMK